MDVLPLFTDIVLTIYGMALVPYIYMYMYVVNIHACTTSIGILIAFKC